MWSSVRRISHDFESWAAALGPGWSLCGSRVVIARTKRSMIEYTLSEPLSRVQTRWLCLSQLVGAEGVHPAFAAV
jgi:hypothetical protein